MAEPRNDLRLWHAVVAFTNAIKAVTPHGFSRWAIALRIGQLVRECLKNSDPRELDGKMREEVDAIVKEAKELPSRSSKRTA